MFDFAASEVGATIYCSSPSEDGHEIENILSPKKKTSQSFMASHFVKPPCDIILSFPFAINIHSIGVSPRVASISSEVISIFVSDKDWTEINDLKNYMDYKYCGTFDELSSKGLIYVYMVNVLYKQNPKYSFPHVAQVPTGMKFSKNMYNMNFVKSVKFRINKVSNSGPPCLKGIEVWGQPCPHTNPSLVSEFFSTINKLVSVDKVKKDTDAVFKSVPLFDSTASQTTSNFMHLQTLGKKLAFSQAQATYKQVNSTNITTTSSMNSTLTYGTKQQNDIPLHFIDPITCELMAEPVLLPSGHTVDKSTIERHLAIHTNDPFSGLPMDLGRVTHDSKLKDQIASFMLERQNTAIVISKKRKSDLSTSSDFNSFGGKGNKLGRLGNATLTEHPLVTKYAKANNSRQQWEPNNKTQNT